MTDHRNINQTTLRILLPYTSDYTRRMHLREIARNAEVDVKAVQLQLRRLESINILSSNVRGRNKEYYLNLENLLGKYYLVLAEVFSCIDLLGKNFPVKKILEELGDRIEGSIILFGSLARGEQTRESDVDLLVLGENPRPRIPWNLVQETGDLIGREISVKYASNDQFAGWLERSDPFAREVLASHTVLKGQDIFCNLLWRHYAKR